MTWAFSPQHTTATDRGYSYSGAALYNSTETYGWAVWVK